MASPELEISGWRSSNKRQASPDMDNNCGVAVKVDPGKWRKQPSFGLTCSVEILSKNLNFNKNRRQDPGDPVPQM